MNYAIVFRLLGYILLIEGTLLLLPAAVPAGSTANGPCWACF